MENKCGHREKDLGCLFTFDGSCSKEECFTYRLMQKLEKIKERLISVSYLEPKTTRILKMDIENIIEGE